MPVEMNGSATGGHFSKGATNMGAVVEGINVKKAETHKAETKGILSFLTKRIWAMPLINVILFSLLLLAGVTGIVPRHVVNNIVDYVKALLPQ